MDRQRGGIGRGGGEEVGEGERQEGRQRRKGM